MENKPSIFDINFKDHIIWQFAFELCEDIAISVKDELMEMAPSVYEENPHGLTSVWDEICVAVHALGEFEDEEGDDKYWLASEDIIKNLIAAKVSDLDTHKKMALYWITPDTEKFPEDTTDIEESDIDEDSIIELILQENIRNMAYDYENEAIYNARCGVDEEE
ncbi:MAG: hypothetical protein IKU13_08145 [Clostridia bacterium]|nr:hypothetical protein [Clostridia bacterium]